MNLIRDRIIAVLQDGPLPARELSRRVSGSDNLMPDQYAVAVELLPMIRAGILTTDLAINPEQDRVVTGTETISLA